LQICKCVLTEQVTPNVVQLISECDTNVVQLLHKPTLIATQLADFVIETVKPQQLLSGLS